MGGMGENNSTKEDPLVYATLNTCISVWVVLVVFGVFGNVLTIRVLNSRRLQQSSTTRYLTLLAVMDLLYLLTSLNATLINFTWLFPVDDLRQRFALLCKLLPFLTYSLSSLSVWLLVAVTIDRMIWVIFPFHAKFICTTKTAVIVSSALIVFFVLMHGHFFFTNTYGLIRMGDEDMNHTTEFPLITVIPKADHNSTNQTTPITKEGCHFSDFGRNVVPYLDLFTIGVIPFIIMIIANSLIIYKLNEVRKVKANHHNPRSMVIHNAPAHSLMTTQTTQTTTMNNNNDDTAPSRTKSSLRTSPSAGHNRDQQRNSSLTTMLLSINIFFMVSTAPLLVYDIFYFAVDLRKYSESNPTIAVVLFMLERLVYTLWYINFSIHFLLYCLTGPRFRAEAIHLLGLKHIKLFRDSSNPGNTNTGKSCMEMSAEPLLAKSKKPPLSQQQTIRFQVPASPDVQSPSEEQIPTKNGISTVVMIH